MNKSKLEMEKIQELTTTLLYCGRNEYDKEYDKAIKEAKNYCETNNCNFNKFTDKMFKRLQQRVDNRRGICNC